MNFQPLDTELSLEVIEKLKLKEARNLCRFKNVPFYRSAQNISDFKRCLRIAFYKESLQPTIDNRNGRRRQPAEAFCGLVNRHKQSCESLKSLFTNLKELLLKIQDGSNSLFKDFNEIVPNFMDQIKDHHDKLGKQNFRILVAGEVVAGKTTLINTLLGEKLLPSCFESNTYTICEITKSPTGNRYAEVHHWPDENEVIKAPIRIDDNGEDDFSSKVAYYIQCKDDEKGRGLYSKIIMYSNNDFLEDGITIVDSPGIGDLPGLTQMVVDELVNAFAFLYVINVTNRLGVQEDRLINLLNKVTELTSFEKRKMFHSQNAIFVCNYWDEIDLVDRESILKLMINQLSPVWQDLTDEQVIPFSALEAELAEEAYRGEPGGCMTPEFLNLLHGIERLIPIGLQNKLNSSHLWASGFLKRMLRQINYIVNEKHKSTADRTINLEQLQKDMDLLRVQSNNEFKSLTKQVDTKRNEYVKELDTLLKSENAIEKICSWHVGKQVNLSDSEEIKQVVCREVATGINKFIKKWDKEQSGKECKGKFSQICPDIYKEFSEIYKNITSKLDKMTSVLDSNDVALDKVDSYISLTEKSVSHMDPIIDFVSEGVKPIYAKVGIGLTSPILVPVGIALIIPGLMYLGIQYIRESHELQKWDNLISQYDTDPTSTLTALNKLQLKIFRKNHLTKHVTEILQPAYNMIDELSRLIPDQIKTDKTQVSTLSNDDTETIDIDKYVDYLNQAKCLHNRMEHFELVNISMISNLGKNRIKLQNDVAVIDATISESLLAVVQHGFYNDQPVSMRSYLKPITPDDMVCFLEEEQTYLYGYKSQKNIAKLIGVVKKEEKVYFVMEPILCNLRQWQGVNELLYIDDFNEKINHILSFMIPMVSGLKYLHDKKITHFDLSMDTVGVDVNGCIKLMNLSSRHRKIKTDGFLDEDPKKYRYIAPEVLVDGSRLYKPSCDMYAVGLMMYELWTGELAYSDKFKTKISMEEFVEYLQIRRPPLPRKITKRICYTKWFTLTNDSWKTDQSLRKTSTDWLSYAKAEFNA